MLPSPVFKQIFWQTWRDLVFVHWEVAPELIQSLLPPELEPELFEGKAYVGLVPFRMTDIRSVWLPPIPGTSRTLETNVRTYVRRRGKAPEPIPAVWFFSLEAQSTLAVLVARLKYGLPYFKAAMNFEKLAEAQGQIVYRAQSSRLWPKPLPGKSLVEATFSAHTPFMPATPGTLEHFLVERYALYAEKRGKLTYAIVRHAPYRIKQGELRQVNSDLLQAAGLSTLAADAAALVHLAEDVIVQIGAPAQV
jgi:uncharacterized protein YqjF (DUF2071 family)